MGKDLSVVVNTAALGEHAEVESSGGVPHSEREYLLNTWILPRLIQDDLVDEIIVSGEWREGEEWIYVESTSEHFGPEDALKDRQLGFETSSGDVIIFQHDDHILGPDATRLAKARSWPVVSPSRWTRMRDPTGERLNEGWSDGYLHGHAIVMEREVCKEVPWGEVPKVFTWDVEQTKMLLDAGYKPMMDSEMRVYDIEFGSEPWT